jgi:hypothetical protein
MENNTTNPDASQTLPATPAIGTEGDSKQIITNANQPAQEASPLPLNSDEFPCPICGHLINANSYFCPNCGRKLKEPPPATNLGKQISLYLFAILVPPFGIVPAIKYLTAKDHKAKIIGYYLLILTIISILVGAWLTMGLIDQFNKAVNLQQLNDLQNAGL